MPMETGIFKVEQKSKKLKEESEKGRKISYNFPPAFND